jgi:aromatic ring-opening dioxygenase LigB subunit
MADGLCLIAMVPHPPKVIEGIGDCQSVRLAAASVESLNRLAARICALSPETVILSTPHAPIARDAFGIHVGDVLRGSFAHYGRPELRHEFECDLALVDEVIGEAFDRHIKTFEIPDGIPMDHGMLVPLHFLTRAGWKGKVVGVGCSFLSREAHMAFGEGIDRAVRTVARRTVFIASGHLSHRVSESGVAGFDPCGRLFDERVVGAVRTGDYAALVQIEDSMRIRASECGYRPLLVALGAAGVRATYHEVLSYEAPFGVGYLVAILADRPAEGEPVPRSEAGQTASP